jgi:peroxiredoxin Q/BCP
MTAKQNEETMANIETGATVPPFSLSNQDGNTISLSDFAGQSVLIWFFPRAFGNG